MTGPPRQGVEGLYINVRIPLPIDIVFILAFLAQVTDMADLLCQNLLKISYDLGGEYGACIHQAPASENWSMFPERARDDTYTAWRLYPGWIVLNRAPEPSVRLVNLGDFHEKATKALRAMEDMCRELGDTRRCTTQCRRKLLDLLALSGNSRLRWTPDDLKQSCVDDEQEFIISEFGELPPSGGAEQAAAPPAPAVKPRTLPPLRPQTKPRTITIDDA